MIAVSNLGPKDPCKQNQKMYVCMWLNWLECAVGDWQHPGPLGQSSECGRATYINSLGQGTNIQLPLSPECQVLSTASIYGKYSKSEVHHSDF